MDYTKDDQMSVAVRRIPEQPGSGFVDPDALNLTFEKNEIMRRYGGEYELQPGINYDEVAIFVVPPGTSLPPTPI